jgi:hypothetical protein
MTQGFQQQDRPGNFSFLKSEPTPQHGQKPDRKTSEATRRERVLEPRPGH